MRWAATLFMAQGEKLLPLRTVTGPKALGAARQGERGALRELGR